MRIDRALIRSYGSLKDEDISFGPLTVVTGPNEAGKSTLRSFITDCLFDKNPMKYPEKKASDSGKLLVTLSDGTGRTAERDGKKTAGTFDSVFGISGKEYVSVYSVDTEDLRDDRPLLDGGIRDRFLTVPGGRALPEVRSALEEERTGYIPDLRRSRNSKIAVLEADLAEKAARAEALKNAADGDGAYNGLVARRKELEKEISDAEAAADAEKKASEAAAVEKSKADSRAKLAELRKRESELAYAERCRGKDDSVLRSDLERARAASEEAGRKLDSCRRSMGAVDPDAVLARARDIENLAAYRPPEPAPAARSAGTKTGTALMALGAVLMAAGALLAAVTGEIYPAGAAAVGAVLLLIGLRKRPLRPAYSSASGPRPGADPLLDSVASGIGMVRTSDRRADIARLRSLLSDAEAFSAARTAAAGCSKGLKEAEMSAELFYSGFGGEEGYAKARKDLAELDSVRQQASALEAAVGPEAAPAEASAPASGSAAEDLVRLSRERGQVEQAIRDIEGAVRTEDAITARSEAENRLYEAVRRWGVLRFEQEILDRASERMFSEHRPAVLSEADRLMSLMTGGRYRLHGDIGNGKITIEDTRTGAVKDSTMWSSGLRDQVLLSLKAAVALGMCSERPPLLLDDVMATFDPDRRRGACRALASLADRMQVIYFTCDPSAAADLAAAGASKVVLGGPGKAPAGPSD